MAVQQRVSIILLETTETLALGCSGFSRSCCTALCHHHGDCGVQWFSVHVVVIRGGQARVSRAADTGRISGRRKNVWRQKALHTVSRTHPSCPVPLLHMSCGALECRLRWTMKCGSSGGSQHLKMGAVGRAEWAPRAVPHCKPQ
jgi:hypothetical protein